MRPFRKRGFIRCRFHRSHRRQRSQREIQSIPIFIDVLPVNVPERLARPQLVVRSGGSGPQTQLFILEQDRWSSPFNYELRDAFASGIASQIGGVNDVRGIRAPDQPGYRIAIELSQFDAIVGDSVQAGFGWTITRSTDGRSIACYAAITEPIGGGIEGVVAGIQRVVASVVEGVSKNLLSWIPIVFQHACREKLDYRHSQIFKAAVYLQHDKIVVLASAACRSA